MDYYKEVEPSPKLANLIKCYWLVEQEHSDIVPATEQQLPPDGCIEVVFNYKSPYLYKSGDEWLPLPSHYIVGQLRSPLSIKASADIGIMAIRLHPWGISTLIGKQPKTFSGKIVELTKIDPELVHTASQLLQNHNPFEAVQQLESLLLSRFSLVSDPNVDFAIQAENYIVHRQGNISVAEMAQHFHLSERQLLRRFEREFGISTKAYARIVRFNSLREKILFDETTSYAITAADYEFTDQAHLNKEIKEMAGHPPKKMKERFDDTIHTFADGQVEFLAQTNRKPSP